MFSIDAKAFKQVEATHTKLIHSHQQQWPIISIHALLSIRIRYRRIEYIGAILELKT